MRNVIKAEIDHKTSVLAHEAAKKARGRTAEISGRKTALRQAEASTALEGGSIDAELREISERYASGEIDLHEYERLSGAYLERYREA